MPRTFPEDLSGVAEPEEAPMVDQASSSTAPTEDTGGSSIEEPAFPQVAVRIADEYLSEAPWNVGFGGYDLELGAEPVEVDQPIADQLLESPLVVRG